MRLYTQRLLACALALAACMLLSSCQKGIEESHEDARAPIVSEDIAPFDPVPDQDTEAEHESTTEPPVVTTIPETSITPETSTEPPVSTIASTSAAPKSSETLKPETTPANTTTTADQTEAPKTTESTPAKTTPIVTTTESTEFGDVVIIDDDPIEPPVGEFGGIGLPFVPSPSVTEASSSVVSQGSQSESTTAKTDEEPSVTLDPFELPPV